MTAYSINWPYVTFSGLNNTLVIINAFERKVIHRIEIAKQQVQESESYQRAYIEKTFITDTKDLFILIRDQNHYLLYTIDLDKTNFKEIDDATNIQDAFKLSEPILKYHENSVNFQNVLAFHVRGSSRKEKIDMNHRCFVFI